MKLLKQSISVISTLVLSLGFAFPAAALTVTGAVDSATNATLGAGSSGYTRTDATVNADVGITGSVSGSNTSGSNSGAAASSNTSGSVSLGILPIVITRAEVEANAIASNTKPAIEVKSNDDLSGYVAAQMSYDNNISTVSASSNHVAVTYKQAAKLFGFIPVKVDTTATVNADGSVSISYPWYVFLASTSKADLQSKIEGKVRGDLSANASAGLSTNEQAKLVNDVKSAMQQQLTADVNASASATGAASAQ
jgi:hypothetical protein